MMPSPGGAGPRAPDPRSRGTGPNAIPAGVPMKRSHIVVLALSLALAAASGAWAQTTPSPTALKQPAFRKSVETITSAQLEDYLSFVASDEMEGRQTPSRGLDITAKFLAIELSRAGVRPAGDDGTYFQKITLKKEKVLPSGTEAELGAAKFTYGKDFLASAPGGSASGAMVFAGDGWFVKSKNLDPYQGIDPKGKIVVIIQGGLPAGMSQQEAMQLLMGGKRGEDWADPAGYAQKKGAVGIVVLQSLFAQASPDQMERTRKAVEEGSFSVEKLPAAMGQSSLPTLVAHLPLAQAIFAREKTDARTILMSFPGGTPVKPFELAADKKLAFTVKTAVDKVDSQNVIGIVEGSDPALKNEYVALGAHYDHSGISATAKGDTIMNGADDDGTGTVALLAMAQALRQAPKPPKRSAVFVWHMGEERGLWGSKYFTAFPTVPLDRIVAQLNIDMIGRTKMAGDTNPRDKDLSGPNEVYVIGSKMLSTELGALSDAVNSAYLKLSFNYKYDDPKDPERFFYRSDHFNYALKNIPVIFYFTGVHADYHQVSDEVSKIDFQKFEKITRTVYAMLWELAELKTRPKVDKQLPAAARNNMF
jgi:hypothetical protein